MSEQNYRTAIISGVVATVLGTLIISLFPGWSWIVRLAGTLARVFTWRAPLWLVVLVLALVSVSVRMLWRRFLAATEPEPEPAFYDYTEDRFFGAVWRWSYYADQPSTPVAFCPRCDMQLVYHTPQGGYRAAYVEQTVLFCENCRTTVVEEDGSVNYLQGRVVREAQRKIRTGEYRELTSPASQ